LGKAYTYLRCQHTSHLCMVDNEAAESELTHLRRVMKGKTAAVVMARVQTSKVEHCTCEFMPGYDSSAATQMALCFSCYTDLIAPKPKVHHLSALTQTDCLYAAESQEDGTYESCLTFERREREDLEDECYYAPDGSLVYE